MRLRDLRSRVFRCRPISAPILGGAAALVLFLAIAPARAGDRYEQPGPVAAADYLDAQLMKGETWVVAAEAINDGLDNTYTIESRFGDWEVRGQAQVETRIAEIHALARLEEVSNTKVFLDAVEASVTAPIRLAKDVAERPKETLQGLPRGVSRWFRRTSFKVRETYHDVSEEVKEEVEERRERKAAEDEPVTEEEAAAAEAARDEKWDERKEKGKELARDEARDYLRISRAERRWYRELGVDPDTDNSLLRSWVKSVARVEGLTNLGMSFVGLPSLPYSGMMRESLNLVWSTDPWDLRLANRKRMLAAGLSKETARAFEDGRLTLTEQTSFLDSMDALEGVAGRELLFATALDLESREEARGLVTMAAMLAKLHRTGSELAEILPGSALPVVRTRAGGLIVAAPAGAVFYTENVAIGWFAFTTIHKGQRAKYRRLYVTGITSERFDAEAKRRGWKVIDRWQPQPAGTDGEGAGSGG